MNRIGKPIEIATVSGKKELKEFAGEDKKFIYDKEKGYLYFNENGSENGWGEGGAFVKLLGTPSIKSYHFEAY